METVKKKCNLIEMKDNRLKKKKQIYKCAVINQLGVHQKKSVSQPCSADTKRFQHQCGRY